MRNVLVFFVFLISIIENFAFEKRYDGHTLYRLTPRDENAVGLLKALEENNSELHFWSPVKDVNVPVDVLVAPTSNLKNLINLINLDVKILMNDVQEIIDEQKKKALSKKDGDGFGWDDYHTLEEINIWLMELAEKHSEVTLIKVGKSYEGREILGVHVSFNTNNSEKAVFLEGNIHACEWIGSAVVTYILNQILTSTDPEVKQMANTHDWYVVPIFNPDGFEYTHSTDRLWRKTRVPHGNESCIGADPNRNWDYHWNDGGSSSDPCNMMYNGPEAFSEPETKSISEYITTIGNKLVGYIAFHSYHQLILIPYGYTADHLDNYDEMYNIGVRATQSLVQRYGTEFGVGNVVEAIYVASGGSMDWVKGIFHTPIVYTFELRDTGEFGFLLPPELIIPSGEETLDALVTIFQEYGKEEVNNIIR